MMAATTLPEVEYSSTRNRFSEWIALAVFSAVALGAHESDDDNFADTSEDKWIVAVTSITIGIAGLSVIAHFLVPDRFVLQPPEAIAIFIVAIVWAGGLPVIMNPGNEFGQRDDTLGGDGSKYPKPEIIVSNANLYFSSWGAFVAILYIAGNLAREANVGTEILRQAPPKTTLWYCLFASSFVVMVASSRFLHTFCSTDDEDDKDFVVPSDSEICKRTKFGVCVGVFGTLFAMILSVLSTTGKVPLMLETGVSFVLLVLYSFGVAYLTFKTGPATTISNFYFSTWAGFVISLLTFGKTVKELLLGQGETSDASPEPPVPSVTQAPKV